MIPDRGEIAVAFVVLKNEKITEEELIIINENLLSFSS